MFVSLRNEAVQIGGQQPARHVTGASVGLKLASLLLVAMPGAPSSVLAPSSDALCS